jgi:ferredoxin
VEKKTMNSIGPLNEYHKITVENTGEIFTCKKDESVLHGLFRTGKKGIPIGCSGGGCGVCKVQVLSGTYGKKKMSKAHVSTDEEREDIVLACRVFPQSDLQIEVVGKLNKAVTRTTRTQPMC